MASEMEGAMMNERKSPIPCACMIGALLVGAACSKPRSPVRDAALVPDAAAMTDGPPALATEVEPVLLPDAAPTPDAGAQKAARLDEVDAVAPDAALDSGKMDTALA
jgi:hypothetical protein